jgi:predicted Zn-dependent protease
MCEHHLIKPGAALAIDSMPIASMHRRDLVRGLWAGSLLLGVGGLDGCETVAKYLEPSDAQLMEMSAQAWSQTKAQTPISKDPKANQRLQSVGPKIALAAGRPNDPWEFVVFDSAEKNAWVLPGGKVGFYKGLMDFCDTNDQVAAVLGHEVGHVIARHAAKRAGQQSASSIGLSLGSYVLGGHVSDTQKDAIMQVAGAGVQGLVILPFSRDNESEADRLGVDFMHTAGYDVRQAITLWDKMAADSSSRPPEWLSTHPDPTHRAADLKAYINAKGYAKV